MPVVPRIFRANIGQNVSVESDRIGMVTAFSIQPHVVRVGVEQDHASVLCNPVHLLLPKVDRALLQQQKERRILGQRVRKLDVAAGSAGGI